MAVQNAIEHIQEIIQNTITLFKTEKILTNVNWSLVEEKSRIEYSIPVSWYPANNSPPFPLMSASLALVYYKNLILLIKCQKTDGGEGKACIFTSFAILVRRPLGILSQTRLWWSNLVCPMWANNLSTNWLIESLGMASVKLMFQLVEELGDLSPGKYYKEQNIQAASESNQVSIVWEDEFYL